MRIEDVQGIATRVEQLLRLTVNREGYIHTRDGEGFVATVTVEECGPGQFRATATTSPRGSHCGIGFTRSDALESLATSLLLAITVATQSASETASSCRDFSAKRRMAAAQRRTTVTDIHVSATALQQLCERLGYDDVEIHTRQSSSDGTWKATAAGRGIYKEAHSGATKNDVVLSIGSRLAMMFAEQCEKDEQHAIESDRKAMAHELLAKHLAAEASVLAYIAKTAAQR